MSEEEVDEEISVSISAEALASLGSFSWDSLDDQREDSQLNTHVFESFILPLQQLDAYKIEKSSNRDFVEAARTLRVRAGSLGKRHLKSLALMPVVSEDELEETSSISLEKLEACSDAEERYISRIRQCLSNQKTNLSPLFADALVQVLTQADTEESSKKKPQLPFRFVADLSSVLPFLHVRQNSDEESDVTLSAENPNCANLTIRRHACIYRESSYKTSPIKIACKIKMHLSLVGDTQSGTYIQADTISITAKSLSNDDVQSLFQGRQLNLDLINQKLRYSISLFNHERQLYIAQLAYWKQRFLDNKNIKKGEIPLIQAFLQSFIERKVSEKKSQILEEEIEFFAYFLAFPGLLTKELSIQLGEYVQAEPQFSLVLSQQLYSVSKDNMDLRENLIHHDIYRQILKKKHLLLLHKLKYGGLPATLYLYRPRWFKRHATTTRALLTSLCVCENEDGDGIQSCLLGLTRLIQQESRQIYLLSILEKWAKGFVLGLDAEQLKLVMTVVADSDFDTSKIQVVNAESRRLLLAAILQYRPSLLAKTEDKALNTLKQNFLGSGSTENILRLKLKRFPVILGGDLENKQKECLMDLLELTRDRWLADCFLGKPIKWFQFFPWLLTWFQYPCLLSLRKSMTAEDKDNIETCLKQKMRRQSSALIQGRHLINKAESLPSTTFGSGSRVFQEARPDSAENSSGSEDEFLLDNFSLLSALPEVLGLNKLPPPDTGSSLARSKSQYANFPSVTTRKSSVH
ncbi:MAG: hypothetical protein DHS20C10_05900 [marine bacterium B5-7]|nr:MAG: hypothetical protein DHS20C10_05900 [marine bacterium B5-7]